MAQVLSQDEVDALLNAVNESEEENVEKESKSKSDSKLKILEGGKGGKNFGTVTDISDDNIQPYDLTNQDKVIRARMPVLEIIYERFIRQFRVTLSNALRKMAQVSIISTDLLKFGEFVQTLPIPTCISLLRFNELRGPALLVFETKLAYSIIDAFFGGSDRPYQVNDGKEFTQIELAFIKKVMDMVISDLEDAWVPVYRIDAQYVRTEINPQFIGVVPQTDVIVATTLEVEFESASGTIMVVIPYSTIEPIKQKLSSSFQTDNDIADSVWTTSLQKHVKECVAKVHVELGSTEIPLGELVNLEVGDVILLKQAADEEIFLKIEETRKMKCVFGSHKGNKAVQITNHIVEKQED